jgi:hypothetical protein
MDENSLPLRVERFVRESIPSVAHLDALVRLVRLEGTAISVDDLSVIMAQKPEVLTVVLEDLVNQGLVERADGGYRFAPVERGLEQSAADLVAAYDRFPVQLIRVVYEPRATPQKNIAAQSFADAFRLRKD